MASISTDKQGNRRILFTDLAGYRKQIRLGRMPLKKAESMKRHVEQIISSQLSGIAIPDETAVWVSKLTGPMLERLARVGMAKRRDVSG